MSKWLSKLIFPRLRLTSKMVLLTLMIGGGAWIAADRVSSTALRSLFEDQLRINIQVAASENRVNFDAHTRKFANTAKQIASMRRVEDYAAEASMDVWAQPDFSPQIHGNPPDWIPRNSILRTMAQFKYALMLDGNGVVKEIYHRTAEPPLVELLNPSAILIRASLDQSNMTYFSGIPYIFSASRLPSLDNGTRPILLLASPIDSDFLNATLEEHRGNRLVALLSVNEPKVMASSNEDLLPIGRTLEAVGNEYFLIGKSYLDYGSSDLRIQFATLVPLDAYNSMVETILNKEKVYRGASALALIAVFIAVMVWMTQRVNHLNLWVSKTAMEMLGTKKLQNLRGDELAILEERFKRLLTDLKESRDRMVEMSRLAGMAEVSTSVLHNVGNALNSVNVSAGLILDGLRGSRIFGLQKASLLIKKHSKDLGAFIQTDEQGRHLPDYLIAVSDHLVEEQEATFNELENLLKSIEHIKEIIAVQQNCLKTGGLAVRISTEELIEDSLRMNSASLAKKKIRILRDCAGATTITVDKQKAIQILVNLIRNAEQSMEDNPENDRKLVIRLPPPENNENIMIEVEDNGMGIPAQNLTRIFAYGFTTKSNGHGFGLHMSALAAKEMGGSLCVRSEGPGCGSVFTLELPQETA